jgi:hypothetical protein
MPETPATVRRAALMPAEWAGPRERPWAVPVQGAAEAPVAPVPDPAASVALVSAAKAARAAPAPVARAAQAAAPVPAVSVA